MGALGEAYVSGALSALGDDAAGRILYELIGEILEGEGLSTYVPHRYTDPIAAPGLTAQTVYDVDRQHVSGAALLVAYAGVPSFGVGIEVEIAREHGVPVVLVVHRGRAVSRMLLGNPAVVEVVRFADLDGLRRSLAEAVRRVSSQPRPPRLDPDEAVVQRFLRTLADARRVRDSELAALLRRGGIDGALADEVRAAVASGRLFGAGLRDLVGRHGLRGEDLALFLSRYVLGRRLPAGGKRRLGAALERLGLSTDDERVAQWLVTELIAPPQRALQLQLFAPTGG